MHLNKEHLKKLIIEENLVSNYKDLERQLTPNGIDLTVEKIEKFKGAGKIDFTNEEREIPETEEVKMNGEWWELEKGIYKVTANEVLNIPLNLVGYAFPRTSLMRMGCHAENGFYEAGYHGKSSNLVVVLNPEGTKIKKDARYIQLAFQEMDSVEEGYRGNYGFES